MICQFNPIRKTLFFFKILFFLLILTGCMKKANHYAEFKIKEDNNNVILFNGEENKTKHIILKSANIKGLFSDISVLDDLLICGNLRDPKLINIYSLKNGKLLNEIITRGTGKNEGLSAASIFLTHNSYFIWIYDITLSKLFKIDLSKAVADKNYIPEKEVVLGRELKNIIFPTIINDSLILATTYSSDDNRYLYADTKKIVRKIGKLPEVENNEELTDRPDTKFPNKSYIFKATGLRNPYENKVAVFYNKADRAEFYLNDNLVKTLSSNQGFSPKMKVRKLEKGFSVEDYSKTRYAYLSVTSSKDYIFCLYSGSENGETSSNRIFIFDWNGGFIQTLFLDRKVCKISFDHKRNMLYFYDAKEGGIFYANLN